VKKEIVKGKKDRRGLPIHIMHIWSKNCVDDFPKKSGSLLTVSVKSSFSIRSELENTHAGWARITTEEIDLKRS